MDNKPNSTKKLIIVLSVLFLIIIGSCLYGGSQYINSKLLLSNEATATDIALLVKNNFEITDAEVQYMKSLTFNEMEIDAINMRLMDVGNGVALHANVQNVYLVVPLTEEEYRYCPDKETANFLGYDMDTPLNGMWLLNGRINDDGVFVAAQREDIYRYTVLDAEQLWGMEHKEPISGYSQDAWGQFITGYAPIYTVEGNFVGLLGIDMSPDRYQSNALSMITILIGLLIATVLTMFGLFIFFYLKYTKNKEEQLQFDFFSRMSHEMRTPMNGILGLAAISKDEADVNVLHYNFAKVEEEGKDILRLMNNMLDYQQGKTDVLLSEAHEQAIYKQKEDKKAALQMMPIEQIMQMIGKKRILLCEDYRLNAEVMRKVLEKVDCTMELAENGQIGLEMFEGSEKGYYEAILMDIRMPVMDGLEATRRIRACKHADAKTIPIIAVTANAYEEDIKNTREAGMNAHLAKPVIPEILYRALAETIFLQCM